MITLVPDEALVVEDYLLAMFGAGILTIITLGIGSVICMVLDAKENKEKQDG